MKKLKVAFNLKYMQISFVHYITDFFTLLKRKVSNFSREQKHFFPSYDVNEFFSTKYGNIFEKDFNLHENLNIFRQKN